MSAPKHDNRPEHIKSNDWDATRKRILRRDGHACQFCGIAESAHQDRFDTGLHIHHIRPREFMGSDHPENLITVCSRCHNTAEKISNHMIETEIKKEIREREGRTDKDRIGRLMSAIEDVQHRADIELDGLEDMRTEVLGEIKRMKAD